MPLCTGRIEEETCGRAFRRGQETLAEPSQVFEHLIVDENQKPWAKAQRLMTCFSELRRAADLLRSLIGWFWDGWLRIN
jgi:hypothetical protein